MCLLARYDPAGVLRWSRSFGTHASFSSISINPEGLILLTGSFEKTVDFGLGELVSAGGFDLFAAILTSDGYPLWAARYGDPRHQFLVRGTYGLDGSIVLAGSFHGTIDFGTGALTASGYDGFSEGSEDAFLVIFEEASRT